jgi:hypothetical protein
LKPGKLVLLYPAIILLANSYAPEPNTGPRTPKYPCGSCQKTITWKSTGVCCDSCDRWYHESCFGMNTLVYQGLHNVSCSCDLCGLPNFSSCIFDTSVTLSPNVYDTFNYASVCDSNIGSRTAASSPIHKRKSHNANYVKHKRYDIPLRVLVMNFQSIKNKTANLENMIQAVQPDIIMACP